MRPTADNIAGCRPLGPWRVCAAALAFALLTLGGCARHMAVRGGWVRVDALAGLHPSAPMLGDLDRRTAGLEEQRRGILARARLEAPPAQTRQLTPGLPALLAPEAWPLPDDLWPRITADAIDRLGAQALAQRNLDYPRRARDLQAELLQGLLQRLEDLRRDAAARRAATDASYARIITRLELGVDAGVGMVGRPPFYPEGAQHLEDRRARLAQTRAEHAAALRAVDARLAEDEDDARREFAEALVAHRQRLWANMTGAINDRMADEHARRMAATPAAWPPPPPLVLPSVPPGLMILTTPELSERYAFADTAARADIARAAVAIDAELAALRRRRFDLALAINADVRRAAQSLAAQHAYVLVFTPDGSPDVTEQAQGWLKGFWHPEAE